MCDFIIHSTTPPEFEIGDKVYIDGNMANDGKYNIKEFSSIRVQNGVVQRICMDPQIKSILWFFGIIFIIIIALFIKKLVVNT